MSKLTMLIGVVLVNNVLLPEGVSKMAGLLEIALTEAKWKSL
jgi:hypothetical protein